VQVLHAAGVPVGPINGVDEAFELAEALGLAPVAEVDGMPLARPPLELSESPAAVRRRPPRLDEHGEEIRAWLRRAQ
jgi:crotonobetainyl-CoA:carnitine CoA-transferase CaiB-like acyl-CoA transferase